MSKNIDIFIRVSIKGFLWIIGTWLGFSLTYIISAFTEINLLLLSIGLITICLIILWSIRKTRFKTYYIVFSIAIIIGAIFSFIYNLVAWK